VLSLFIVPFEIIIKRRSSTPDLTNQFSTLENWKLEAIWLIPNILTTSTCLHALLLTSLRLLSLEMPLQFKVRLVADQGCYS